MGRGSIKQKPINREFGRRSTVAMDYVTMMRKLPFKAAVNERPEPYSEFEKPYLTKDYHQMQGLHHSNFRGGVPLLAINPFESPGVEIAPQPTVEQCLHLSIGSAPIGMIFGESYQFIPNGGDGNYFFRQFSGPGSISAQGLYSMPLLEGVESSFIVVVGVTDGCRVSKGALSRGANLFSTATFVIEPPEVEDEEVTEVSDTFTDSDSTELSTHIPDIGTGWTKVVGGDLEINSNILTYKTTSAGSVYTADGITIADGYVEAFSYATNTITVGLYFRYVDSSNYYELEGTNTDLLRLWKVVAGVPTLLMQTVFDTGAGSETIKCVFSGSDFEMFRNGVSKGTTTDGTFSTGGVAVHGHSGTTHDNIMDDFVAVST